MQCNDYHACGSLADFGKLQNDVAHRNSKVLQADLTLPQLLLLVRMFHCLQVPLSTMTCW